MMIRKLTAGLVLTLKPIDSPGATLVLDVYPSILGASAWVRSQPELPGRAFSSVIGLAAASEGSASATPSPSSSWRKKLLTYLRLRFFFFLHFPLTFFWPFLHFLALGVVTVCCGVVVSGGGAAQVTVMKTVA